MSSYRHSFFLMCLFFHCDWCFSTAVNFVSTSFFFFCKSGELVFLLGNWLALTNWTHSQKNIFFFYFFLLFYFCLLPFPWQGFVPKQSSSVLKQRRWIRRGSVMAYETWQVIPNYWKLANCWSISSQPDMFYTRTNTKWTRLLERFVSLCTCESACVREDVTLMFGWIHRTSCFAFFLVFFACFLHLFFLSRKCHFSPKWHSV